MKIERKERFIPIDIKLENYDEWRVLRNTLLKGCALLERGKDKYIVLAFIKALSALDT